MNLANLIKLLSKNFVKSSLRLENLVKPDLVSNKGKFERIFLFHLYNKKICHLLWTLTKRLKKIQAVTITSDDFWTEWSYSGHSGHFCQILGRVVL